MAQLLDPEQWGKGTQPADDLPPGPRRTGSTSGPPPGGARREPAPGASSGGTSPRARGSRLPLILAVVLVVLALVAGGVWAAASGLLPLGTPGGTAAPDPTDPPPGTAEPQPSATPSAAPVGTPVPASCDELYSDGMRGTLEGMGLALNPEWLVEVDPGGAAAEEELIQILASADNLDCFWVAPDGPGDAGLATSVTAVTAEQAATVEQTLTDAGYTVIEELGSRRFVSEMSGPDGTTGFSHIVRDGLWFATRWFNAPVSGYTADMVTQVFG